MKEKNCIVSTELLLACFRSLTPEAQKALIETLKALGAASGQRPDSGASKK